MIQIIALRNARKKDGKKTLFHRHIKTIKPLSVADLFKKIDKAVDMIPEDERWNIYYTALNCVDPDKAQRRLRVFESQKIIPFDVDNLDIERLEEYKTIFFELTKLDPNKTGCVFSGNGLQFIVEIPEAFTEVSFFQEKRAHYKSICSEYDSMLKKAGLPGDMDSSVWSPARILRLPNTENRKEKKGIKQARMLQANIEAQEFDWEGVSKIATVQEVHHISDWNPKNNAAIDHKEIYKQCNFFQWLRDSPGEVREPQYYAGLSIMARMDDGSKRAHTLQQKISETSNDTSVASYSFDEVEKKIDQALNMSGPRTCQGIDAIWGKCSKCPHYQKVNSPVSFKGEEFIATADSGFHRYDAKGRPIPQVDDLVKFFNKETPFKTINTAGAVYVYRENHYQLFTMTELKGFARKHFSPNVTEKTRKEFADTVKVDNLVPIEFFTEKTNGLLNFQNGVLNLKTKELVPHSPEFGFRYILPYSYDPEAKAPAFEKFIKDVLMNDENMVKIIQEFGGYALSGDKYKYHKFLMLTGGGRNGKGTLVNVLKKLAGKKNCSDVPMGSMGRDINKQLMEGKLFNFCDEINKNDFRDIGELKKMTGDGTIMVRQMYGNPYTTEARAKLIFACNKLPELAETNTAIRNRLILVPFNNEYTEQRGNIDYSLPEKLEAELSGIFNFFLEGYVRLEKNGRFTDSKVISDWVQDYFSQSNPVIDWMEETGSVEVKPLNGKCTFVKTSDLLTSFNDWWIGKGKEYSMKEFVSKFKEAVSQGSNRKGRIRINDARPNGFFDVCMQSKTYDTESKQLISNTHTVHQNIPTI